MPAQPYFQAAAAELRKAVLEKRHEIDLKKREIADKEQAANRQLQDLKSDRRQKESQAGSSDLNDQERVVMLAAINQDINEIMATENNFSQERDRLTKEINDIERDIIDIENKIRELETRT